MRSPWLNRTRKKRTLPLPYIIATPVIESPVGVFLQHIRDFFKVYLLMVHLVEAAEMPHAWYDSEIELGARPRLPHLDHVGLVVMLVGEMPRVDREVELWSAAVLEDVFVKEHEVPTRQAHVHLAPVRLVKDQLRGALEVAPVPVPGLLLHHAVVQVPLPVPGAPLLGQVGRREGHEEAGPGHRQPDPPRQHEELERHPGPDRVGPDHVGDTIGQLVPAGGQQVRGQRVGGDEVRAPYQLVAGGVVEGAHLDARGGLGPLHEGRPGARVDRLGGARAVEAEDPQPGRGQGVAEHPVLRAVQRPLAVHLLRLRAGAQRAVQLLVHRHGTPALPGAVRADVVRRAGLQRHDVGLLLHEPVALPLPEFPVLLGGHVDEGLLLRRRHRLPRLLAPEGVSLLMGPGLAIHL
mmetsp:Transcript_126741/g.358546  ORF Transcript_126741/g.358546 Transcript_126741/m.358546 type:complete len:406 (+) Transcript_126741:87-1304(+)